jgi:predicted MFS family arabinose efflux permease
MPFILTSISTFLFSLVGGRLLDQSLEYYRSLLWIMALSALVYSWVINRIPSTSLSARTVGNPWQNLSLIWKDRLFGYLLGSWMLLGLGHLITVPIRVEYLANPEFGINSDNVEIAFLLAGVPSIVRMLSTKLWACVFDRFHLVTMRNLLSVVSLIAMALFFFAKSLTVLTIAMVFFGLSMGGGKIIWHLWVIKIAPPEKVSAYMSVHMAFTGLRGTVAPFLGYWILRQSTPQGVAWAGMLLIFISMVLFECLRKHKRFAG